ncbi:hypothetical protein [Deinococcus psychrotolerans]|nr:hypothetical protein [Deinococcus psychrotolerans]
MNASSEQYRQGLKVTKTSDIQHEEHVGSVLSMCANQVIWQGFEI